MVNLRRRDVRLMSIRRRRNLYQVYVTIIQKTREVVLNMRNISDVFTMGVILFFRRLKHAFTVALYRSYKHIY